MKKMAALLEEITSCRVRIAKFITSGLINFVTKMRCHFVACQRKRRAAAIMNKLVITNSAKR
jgi:hypothetical protein